MIRCTKWWLSQNFKVLNFLPWNFQKINFREKLSIKFLKNPIFKKPYNVCHVCSDYIYAKFQVNRFENVFHIVQKLWKCPYEKFSNSNSFFFWQKYAIQKDENSTIELPVKFCIETMLFVVKITFLKFSPFFTGISQIHVLTFTLTLTSHVTYL